MSNWLSGLSKDVGPGPELPPGDAISQEEVELAVSTQLFNEKTAPEHHRGCAVRAGHELHPGQLTVTCRRVPAPPDGKLRLKATT